MKPGIGIVFNAPLPSHEHALRATSDNIIYATTANLLSSRQCRHTFAEAICSKQTVAPSSAYYRREGCSRAVRGVLANPRRPVLFDRQRTAGTVGGWIEHGSQTEPKLVQINIDKIMLPYRRSHKKRAVGIEANVSGGGIFRNTIYFPMV